MKKYILSLLLAFILVVSLTACNAIGGVFVRSTSTIKNSTTPTTTNKDLPSSSTNSGEEGKYIITYHENGHGTKPSDLKNVSELPNPLPIMTATGYKFLGWSLASDSEELVTAGTKINKNTDLYAVWQEIGYKLIFHENGHGEKPDDIENVREIPNNLPELEDEGYDFIGWAKSASSRTKVLPGARVSSDLDLYAIWAKGRYTITYDANGHGETPAPKTNTSKIPNTLPILFDNDYTFLGWSYEPDSDDVVTPGEEIIEDITLYGVWDEKMYNIVFHENGHGEKPNDIEGVTKIPKVLPELEAEGYDFIGWSKSSTSKTIVEAGTKITSNIDLYAVWVKGTYTITYDANGHGEAPVPKTNTSIIPNRLPSISDDDYKFLGWSYDSDSQDFATPGEEITEDITLYAIWEETIFTITFDNNGHGTKPQDIANVHSIPEDLPKLEEKGYKFIGWSLDKDSSIQVETGARLDDDTVLFAIWEKITYTVTYDSNGIGDAPEDLKNVTKLPDTLPQLLANDYNFIGWSLASDSEELVKAGSQIYADTVLYAVWKAKTYELTYDANGHGTAPTKVKDISRIPNPLPQMSEDGYTFKGWSKSNLSTKLVTPGEKLSSNITLYGVWKKNTYRIIYHNNGRGTAPNETVGVTSLPDQLPSMTYDDYDFLGWGIEKDSTEPVTPGTPISSNVDLYAIWSLKTYTITYDANGHGTAPNNTIGAVKLPEILPTIQDVDDFNFVGWTLENGSNELVESGKKIFKDTTLFAVWIDTANTIDTVTLKSSSVLNYTFAANDLDGSNNTYAGLNRIVYVVKYLNGSEIEVPVDKTMISDEDYLSLQTAGTHDISINVFEFKQQVTINTQYYWNIAYYVRGDLIQCYPFLDGTNSNTPPNPADYLDENNVLWTFDKWSESDENVHKHMNIDAIFKEVEIFSYNVAINSDNEITVVAEYDNTRVTDYILRIVDNDTNYEHSSIVYPYIDSTVSGLTSSKTYKITGTVTFTFNDASYDQAIEEKIVTTTLVTSLASIDYQYDENTISDKAISLDITEYADNSPEGYELNTVYLVKEDGEIAGEYKYSAEEPIAYFDNLEASTKYRTYFFYAKKLNLTSFKVGRKYAKLNYDYFEEYGFCFVGFYVSTRSASATLREIKMVYNDPNVGQRILYRYYVESGNDFPYSTNLFSNPWSFALPLSLRGNYAYGDYRDLKGVTQDKEVEVMLMPMNDYGQANHKIIFLGSTFDYTGNKSSYETNYHNGEYIIAVVDVNDNEMVQIPTGFTYHIPQDTTKYHYEFKWGTQGIISINLEENITCSGIVHTSYKELEKLLEPVFYNNTTYFVVGDDFFGYDIDFRQTASIIQDSFDVYLTVGAMGGTTRVNEKSNSKYEGLFEGLPSGQKYTFHYEFEYDKNDGTGVHKKSVEVPFATTASSLITDMTLNSPNTQTVNVTWSHNNPNNQYGVILIDSNETKFEYDTYEDYRKPFSKTAGTISVNGLKANTTYNVYTYDKSNCSIYLDDKTDSSDAVHNNNEYRVSSGYTTIKTKDGIEPLSFTLEVDYKNGTNHGQHPNGEIRLKIDNCPGQDIGSIHLDVWYVLYEYTDYGNPRMGGVAVSFDYDQTAGCYRYSSGLSGTNVYKALFGEYEVEYQSQYHRFIYSYHGNIEEMTIRYFFNDDKSISNKYQYNKINIEWVPKN